MDYFKSGSAKEDCNFTLRKQRRLRKRMVRILSDVYVVWTLQRGRRYGSTKAMSVPEVCARCLCLAGGFRVASEVISIPETGKP